MIEFIYCIVGLLIYNLYAFIVAPMLTRKYYSKYRNVYIPTFIPIFGDYYHYLKNVQLGKAYYSHLKYETKELMSSKSDFKLFFEGNDSVLLTVSHQARREMLELTPSKIDRYRAYKEIDKLLLGSLVYTESTDECMERLKLFIQEFSLKSSSRYIPIMLKSIQSVLKEWKKDQKCNIVSQMGLFTFKTFTMVLFGNDTERFVYHKLNYQMKDGSFKELPFCEYFFQMMEDHIDAHANPVAMFCPPLGHHNVFNPCKRNNKNKERYLDCIKLFMEEATDENSIYSNIVKKSKIDKDVLAKDFLAIIFAGAETASNAIVSTLYLLK
jgi:cytochrome P450